jgi:cell division septum initiation protein DivIVA
MTPGLCLDSGEFIPASELNMTHEFETKRPKEHPPVISITDENEKQQQRISELEAQIAQLTESLETASSAVIVLKQQQREEWAQLASGQEPTGLCVDWLSNVIRQADGNNKLGAGALAETIVEAVSGLDQDRPIASGQGPQLLGRVELQREAKHPAPCASHCEAPAFKIEIRQLKTQIEVNRAQPPAQQPLTVATIADLAMQSGAYDEQLLAFARAIEAAVLEKLADKLRDAERYQQVACYMAGDHTHLDDCFVACTTVEQISAICDKHLSKKKP